VFLDWVIEMKSSVAKLLASTIVVLLCLRSPANAIILVLSNREARDCFLIAKAGNAAAAIAACDSALERGLSAHDRAATLINRGVVKVTLNRMDDAIADFNIGIAMQPSWADAYVDRAIALITLRRYDEALADINRCIALGPTRPAVGYYNRGVIEQRTGKFQDAYIDYQRALQIEPTLSQAGERLHDVDISAAATSVTPPP
jgi:tetratricopeptide (TPR) repeat protein